MIWILYLLLCIQESATDAPVDSSPLVRQDHEAQDPANSIAVLPLSDEEFQQLHAELVPRDKLWLTIPWQTSLLEAQRIAAREHKPIFIWAMDGHPLGCT